MIGEKVSAKTKDIIKVNITVNGNDCKNNPGASPNCVNGKKERIVVTVELKTARPTSFAPFSAASPLE